MFIQNEQASGGERAKREVDEEGGLGLGKLRRNLNGFIIYKN